MYTIYNNCYVSSPIMRKYQQQYIKENGFDDYVMEQAMLNSGHTGTSKMIPGYLPPPPMPPLPDNDLDADIGYKSLPPLPPFNGKGDFGGIAGRSVKYRVFNSEIIFLCTCILPTLQFQFILFTVLVDLTKISKLLTPASFMAKSNIRLGAPNVQKYIGL